MPFFGSPDPIPCDNAVGHGIADPTAIGYTWIGNDIAGTTHIDISGM